MTPNLQRLVVAATSYLARHGHPKGPEDLKSHNCIRIRTPTAAVAPWVFLVDGKEMEIDVAGSLVLNNPELDILSAVIPIDDPRDIGTAPRAAESGTF
jgi:hypothetical protein